MCYMVKWQIGTPWFWTTGRWAQETLPISFLPSAAQIPEKVRRHRSVLPRYWRPRAVCRLLWIVSKKSEVLRKCSLSFTLQENAARSEQRPGPPKA